MNSKTIGGKLVALSVSGGDCEGSLCIAFEDHELEFRSRVADMYPGRVLVHSYRECTLLEAAEFRRRFRKQRVRGNWYKPTKAVMAYVAYR